MASRVSCGPHMNCRLRHSPPEGKRGIRACTGAPRVRTMKGMLSCRLPSEADSIAVDRLTPPECSMTHALRRSLILVVLVSFSMTARLQARPAHKRALADYFGP